MDTIAPPARKLRLGFVGGAPPSFIGRVHRIAARYDDRFEIVAGVFSSRAESNQAAAAELRIPADRIYADVGAMLEGERGRIDKIDLVAILTPNGAHYEVAARFMEQGYHILCEKPVTTRLADALALIELQQKHENVFVVAHAYTGYTMVRHARRVIREGLLGPLRVVQVEYAQGWLATAMEATGDKVARNRTNPEHNGAAGCLAAIGTHAFNLAEYVTSLELASVSANVKAYVGGRVVPDNANLLLRYEQGVTGSMWVSQVAAGLGSSIKLRVVGELGTVEWSHDDSNRLHVSRADGATTVFARGGAIVDGPLRAPAGHPEGFTDAFANLYAGVADLVERAEGMSTAPRCESPVPTLIDGARAVAFANAALESSAEDGAWKDARLRPRSP